MTVAELIEALRDFDGDRPVVIAGADMGLGVDIELDKVHRYDGARAVRLFPGDEYEEE